MFKVQKHVTSPGYQIRIDPRDLTRIGLKLAVYQIRIDLRDLTRLGLTWLVYEIGTIRVCDSFIRSFYYYEIGCLPNSDRFEGSDSFGVDMASLRNWDDLSM